MAQRVGCRARWEAGAVGGRRERERVCEQVELIHFIVQQKLTLQNNDTPTKKRKKLGFMSIFGRKQHSVKQLSFN